LTTTLSQSQQDIKLTPPARSYITSILGFKLALLFSYLRFLPIATYRVAIYCIAAACVMFHLSFLLVQINLCQPARKQWDPAVTWGKCIPGVPFYTSMASITIVFDVTVYVSPFLAFPFYLPPSPPPFSPAP